MPDAKLEAKIARILKMVEGLAVGRVLQRLVHRPLWWGLTRYGDSYDIRGVPFFMYRRSVEKDPDAYVTALDEAMGYVEKVGLDFASRVRQELRFVAATLSPREAISTVVKGYFTSFKKNELDNSFYLATKLIWVASFLESFRQAKEKGIPFQEDRARAVAFARQKAFIRATPHPQEWLEWTEKEEGRGGIDDIMY
ncbi:MAG: hypothetical protein ACREMD_08225 [Gemmatimonadota bacterium]